jgi:hypothetical protein
MSRGYQIVCISAYVDELEIWDRMVERLRGLGHTRASRSSLIRQAISAFEIDRYQSEPTPKQIRRRRES